MNPENQNTRRSFFRKILASGVLAIAYPEMLVQADSVQNEKRKELRKGLVLLFQGDSITDGNRGRNTDPNHIMGHGYAFSIASRLGADFPELDLKFYNRGISGNTVSDLADRWQKDTLELKPDILSILVGVNDVDRAIKSGELNQVVQFENMYRLILEQTKTQFSDVQFVLCEPFILPVGRVKENWEAWNSEVMKRQAVVRKLAIEFDAVLVEFQKVLNKASKSIAPEYWIWDGIHPTVPGHELLTREWLKCIRTRFKF
ncbi:MAG: SGNH/GDSL hydrolase family protein [Prolixibacteraceae bacterium]